jgi:hypothetical protein
VSRDRLKRRFFPNIGWAALLGFVVTMAGAYATRFTPEGRLLLPFGDNALGPLGDVIFNSCWIFIVLNLFVLLKTG